ncbi:trypsin-like peptidase domain-containing protein [Candidatus Woesearchaeota archaeon]|nr:trypsin-like peptidase domain-containing protein [Candidatus Woesearchaeota archaeon]
MSIKKWHLCAAVFGTILILIVAFFLFIEDDDDPFPASVKKVTASTVELWVKESNGAEHFVGTGFIVDERGYILTAKHNFETLINRFNLDYDAAIATIFYVKLKGFGGVEYSFNVTRVPSQDLERKDVQMVKINPTPDQLLPSVEIADKNEIILGAQAGFLGYTPLEQGKKPHLFINKGVLSNLELELEGQTDAFYTLNSVGTEGYSGGPVFLSNGGNVFGVVKGGNNKPGILFVPHIHEIPELIEEFEERFVNGLTSIND